MAQNSLYHSATGEQAPQCIHVVGIGRSGAGAHRRARGQAGRLRSGAAGLQHGPEARQRQALSVRVDEDADHRTVSMFVRQIDQRKMPVMQRAHGRNQSGGLAITAPFGGNTAQLVDRSDHRR